MRVGIVGAGITGLTAAHELAGQGHEVTVYEAAPVAGGLSSGFRAPGWDWTLDRFYRHIFAGDHEIVALARELRVPLTFSSPATSVWVNDHPYRYDSPMAAALYPGLPLLANLWAGAAIAYLKYGVRDGTRLEGQTADRWLLRAMGARAYRELWEPMLRGKFKQEYDRVNMAWFWARIRARTPRLGYFDGGFQVFVDRLLDAVREQGGEVHLAAPVREIGLSDGRIALLLSDGSGATFDRVLTTTSPAKLGDMLRHPASGLSEPVIQDLAGLESMATVVLILALDRSVMTDGTYWLNLPPDQFPCLSMVEHTNYQDKSHYGGDVIVYLGDYVPADAPQMQMETEALYTAFRPALAKVQPAFDDSWVRAKWSFREVYAQPVPKVNHSLRVPAVEAPIIPNLFWACMHHVYPWDRGTNYAVALGQRAARAVTGSGG